MTDHLFPSHCRELVRLNHAEFWILDMVEEYSEGIHWLVNGDYGNNKRFYRYSRGQLFDAFERLVRDRWIVGLGMGGKRVELTRELVKRELGRPRVSNWAGEAEPDPPVVFYCLTADGGKAWESFACPVWDHCIDGIWFSDATKKRPAMGMATCASREHLERYLRNVTTARIDFGTLRWKRRRAWKPRYWKRLAVGYEASFVGEAGPFSLDVHDPRLLEWHEKRVLEGEFLRWYSRP
jgi:hypothetical protein